MKQLYKGGQASPLLHPIDARSWVALGWSETPPKVPSVSAAAEVPESLTPTPDPPTDSPPALALINSAEDADAITVLPTIGTVSATTILTNRPTDGYPDMAALKALGLSRVDWVAVEAWEG